MATSSSTLTEAEINDLEKDDYLGVLDLMEKHGIPFDEVENMQQALARLWTVLGKQQSTQPQYNNCQGVLKNILNENQTTHKRLLANLDTLVEFMRKLPPKFLQILDKVCPCHAKELKNIRSQLVQKQDYTLLVVDESRRGKSAVLNLLHGHMSNDFRPISDLSSTSVICELKYGKEKRMIVHRHDDSEPPLVVDLANNAGKIISKHTHQKGRQETTFMNKRVEIFWPLDWLEDGITLVDTPGIGEDKDLTQLVEEAMKRSFGVIYVLNNMDEGGINSDRFYRLLELHGQSLTQGDGETLSLDTIIIIFNKWDQMKEKDKTVMKDEIINQLVDHGFKRNQVFFLSCTSTMSHLQAGFRSQTADQTALLQGIQYLISSRLRSKLHRQYKYMMRVLDGINKIQSTFSKEYTKERLTSIRKVIEEIGRLEQDIRNLLANLKDVLQQKYKIVVQELQHHFKSPDVVSRITTWQKNDEGDPLRDEGKDEMLRIIRNRIHLEMMSWENETHLIHKQLLSIFQNQCGFIMSKHHQIQMHMFATENCLKQINHLELNCMVQKKIASGLTFPLWLPIATVVDIGQALFDICGASPLQKNTEEEMSNMSTMVLQKLDSTDILEKLLRPLQKQLVSTIEEVATEIMDNLTADKVLLRETGIKQMVNVFVMNDDLEALSTTCRFLGNNLEKLYLTSIKVFPIRQTELSLEQMIGKGTFAEVFIGKWNEKTVAIKRVKSPLSSKNADIIVREEANLWALQNPHVVTFYGCSSENTTSGVNILFVMEYCHTTLSDYIYPETGISKYTCPSSCTEQSQAYVDAMICAVNFAIQIVRGLNAIHQLGHVHRDLKPENILVTSDGIIKIADLGLAKDVTEIRGTVCGTILYMAPEVMEGEIYSQKADMFGYGMIMWELWYGECVLTKYKVRNMTEFINIPYLPGKTMPDATYDQIMRGCWKMNPDDRLSANTCEERLRRQYLIEESELLAKGWVIL